MKNQTAIPLSDIQTLKVTNLCENPKLANVRITIMQESYGEDGIYYPPQDVFLYGPAIAKLREALAELPAE